METQTKQKIHLLPEHIIDQIKAGEVIERPSTLLKEMLENSIDAESTEISVHLRDNGLELINIQDNGNGIDSEDLPLAFCRHATSKIKRFEDIYHLHSYGFRGEALASIASIAKVRCESKTSGTTGSILIEGGETKSHQSDSLANEKTGTKFFIKDLFYNTPVRMKFIQSKTSEKNQLKKMLRAFQLTQPQVSFSIKWDDLDREFYPARESLADRIKDTLFPKQNISLNEIENSYDGVQFKIFLTNESTRGNAHKSHFIFINERVVQDIQIHKIILNSASALWPDGETGHYVAYIDIPADEIDVNIHPNKTVVKLFKPSQIYSLASGSIKNYIAKMKFNELNEHRSTLPEQTQILPKETSPDTQIKDIDYKQINFSHPETVDNYLTNIHNQNTNSAQLAFSQSFDEYTLTIFNNELYLYHINDLLLLELTESLSLTPMSLDESIPLLVSRPIKMDEKVTEGHLNSLAKFGFEVDSIDEKTVVVRSFPRNLQQLPYLKIAQELLLNPAKPNWKKLNLSDGHSYNIQDLIQKHGLSKLTQNGIIKKITKSHLKEIYEAK